MLVCLYSRDVLWSDTTVPTEKSKITMTGLYVIWRLNLTSMQQGIKVFLYLTIKAVIFALKHFLWCAVATLLFKIKFLFCFQLYKVSRGKVTPSQWWSSPMIRSWKTPLSLTKIFPLCSRANPSLKRTAIFQSNCVCLYVWERDVI